MNVGRVSILCAITALVCSAAGESHAQNPAPAKQHLEEGLRHYRNGELSESLNSLTQAIHEDPGSLSAYAARALTRHALNDRDDGIADDINKSTGIAASDAESLTLRGNAEVLQANIPAALADFNRALELQKNYADAYLGRGRAYRASGSLAKAIENWTEAVRLDPKLLIARFDLGRALHEAGQTDRALDQLILAAKTNPAFPLPHAYLGVIHAGRGELEKAVSEYSEAIRLHPHYAYAYLGRATVYLLQGKNNLAFHDYAQAVRSSRTDYAAYYNIGEAYWRLGDKVSALTIFRKCMTMDVRYAPAAIAMGDHFFSEGLNQESLENYTRAIGIDVRPREQNPRTAVPEECCRGREQLFPNRIRWIESAFLKRAVVKQKLGDNPGALEDLNQAVRISSGAAEALTARSKLYFQLRQDAAAQADIDRAIAADPKSPEARLARSQLLAETKEYRASMTDLDAAIRAAPRTAEAYDMRGLLWAYGFSNYDKAVADISTALGLAPDNPQLYFDMANVRMLRRDFLKAAGALTSALNLGSAAAPILERRAKAYAMLGNFTGAFQDIHAALKRDPDVGSLRTTLAAIDILAQEPDQALQDMKSAQQDGLDSAELHMILGRAYETTGNLGKAAKEFKRAVRLNPRSAQAHAFLCRALRLDRETATALAACDRAITLDPKNSAALIDRGFTHLALKNYKQAVSDFDEGYRMGARYAEAELARSIACAALRRTKEADEAYRSALNLDPKARKPDLGSSGGSASGNSYSAFIQALNDSSSQDKNDPYAFLVRGDALFSAGDLTRAFNEYSKALQVGEPVFAEYLNRCSVLAAQKSWRAADYDCRRALELAPDEPAVYLQLLKLLEQRRDYDAGIRQAAIAIRSAPRSPDIRIQAGKFLYFLYDFSGAEQNYASALSMDPYMAEAHIGTGICQSVKKQYDDAIESFSRAIALNDRHADYYLHRASAYAGLGDHANAAANYRIALAVNRDLAAVSQIEKLRKDALARAGSHLIPADNQPNTP